MKTDDDPDLIFILGTYPSTTLPPSRYYWIKVKVTPGTMTNATRTFTTLAGAISVVNEILDDAGFTGSEERQQMRDDLRDWLESEWLSPSAYYSLTEN